MEKTIKFSRILSISVGALALAACIPMTPRLNPSDSQAVASAINIQHDNFKKTTNYTGPNAASDLLDAVFIRAWKTDGAKMSYQIYVKDYYNGEWRFYNSAYDSDGNSLNTTVISRDVSSCSRYGCSHEEHIGLNVTREYLEKKRDTGINFKVSGKAGEEIFYIPSGYIRAFLDATK
jgi:hypothetical protein